MKLARWFLYLAGVFLLVAAAAKLTSSAGQARILLERDPVTGFQFRDLFRIVGGIEATVALTCFFSRQRWLPVGLVAWLATSFLAYRVGLWRIGWHKPCSCLGNLTAAIHVSPQVADNIMKGVLAYLLVGSYATLFWLWRQRLKASTPSALGQSPR